MTNYVRGWLYRSIGIVIFVFILRIIDFAKIRLIIDSSPRLWIVLFALPLTFVIVSIRFYRWYRISKHGQMTFPLREGLLIYIASFGLGIITPGRVGEFIKINYLRNIGYEIGKSFFSLLIDRFSDIMLMILFALAGSFVVFRVYSAEITKIAIAGIVLISGLTYVLLKRQNLSGREKMEGGHRRTVASRVFRELEQIPSYMKEMGWLGTAEVITISLTSWAVFFVQNFLFSLSLNFGFTYFQIAFITSMAGLVALIPISISGLGTRDMTLIYLFSHFGLEKEAAVLFSGCMLLTLIMIGLVSFIPWEVQEVREKLFMLRKNPE